MCSQIIYIKSITVITYQTIRKLKQFKPLEQQVQNQNNIEEHPLMESIQDNYEKLSYLSSNRTSSDKIPSYILINTLYDQMEFIKKGITELVKQNSNCKCQQLKNDQNIKQGNNKFLLFFKSENTYDKNKDSDKNKLFNKNLKQDLQDAKNSLIQQEEQLKLQLQEMNQIQESKDMLDSSHQRQKIQQFQQTHEELKGNLIFLKQIQELNQKLADLDNSYQEQLKVCKAKLGIKI